MLAGIIFQKEPFFMGSDNYDQLAKITQLLGTQGLEEYISKYGIRLDSEFEGILPKHDKVPWETLVTPRNKHLANPAAIVLLDKMLCYDHYMRPTAAEAMADPYFDIIRKEEEKGLASQVGGVSTTSPGGSSSTSTSTSSTVEASSSPTPTSVPSAKEIGSSAKRS